MPPVSVSAAAAVQLAAGATAKVGQNTLALTPKDSMIPSEMIQSFKIAGLGEGP